MTKREQLEKGFRRVQEEYNAHMGDLETEREGRLGRFREELDAELEEKYGKRARELQTKLAAARNSLEDHNQKHPVVLKGWPAVGTTVVEWKWVGYGGLRKAGRKGVIEVFKRGDALSDTLGSYRMPRPGEVVVRVMKKNGLRGLGVVRSIHRWHLEGVDPNKEVKE